MNLEEKFKLLDRKMNSQLLTIGQTIEYSPITRMAAFLVAIDETNCQCFICGYSPCENYGKDWDNLSDDEQKELRPHRIVHGCFGGRYIEDNIVPLCRTCHFKEYGFFREWWKKRPVPKERSERIKYFFEMFKVFMKSQR